MRGEEKGQDGINAPVSNEPGKEKAKKKIDLDVDPLDDVELGLECELDDILAPVQQKLEKAILASLIKWMKEYLILDLSWHNDAICISMCFDGVFEVRAYRSLERELIDFADMFVGGKDKADFLKKGFEFCKFARELVHKADE